MKHITIMVVFIVIFSGCKKSTVNPANNSTVLFDVQINLNDTTTVNLGQTAGLVDGELVFKFDSIIGDGRCPIGVVCVWEGDASIHLTFPDKEDTLHTYLQFKNRTTDGNYTIKLVNLFPYPVHNQSTDTLPHYALFLISKT